MLTLSTSVLSFIKGGIFSEQKRLTSLKPWWYLLSQPVQDPLAVLLLDNRLFIYNIYKIDDHVMICDGGGRAVGSIVS